MKQSIEFSFGHFAELLGKFGLDHVSPDPIVLGEQVVEQPAVLREERSAESVKETRGSTFRH